MRKIVLGLLIVFGLNQISLAQPRAQKEKIESMKIGFITKQLNLTSDEAQKFWPVYNKFSADMDKLRQNMRKLINEDFRGTENLSEPDADKALTEIINFKEQEAILFKKYATEFKKILPSSKVLQLFKAENDFKRELLKELRERRGSDGMHKH